MITKKCEWCTESFDVKNYEYWRFLCNDCYFNIFVPLKHKYDLKGFRKNIPKLKAEYEKTKTFNYAIEIECTDIDDFIRKYI